MKNLKLMMFAAAGLLVPVAAQADIARITQAKMVPSPTTDLAEVTGTPARLRRQNERQPGNEDTSFSINADRKGGVYYSMATELNGVRAFDRIQLAAVPFSIEQDATGAVVAKPNMAAAPRASPTTTKKKAAATPSATSSASTPPRSRCSCRRRS